MTIANYHDLIELAGKVFQIIEAVKTNEIHIEEFHLIFKGITIGGYKAEDLNV